MIAVMKNSPVYSFPKKEYTTEDKEKFRKEAYKWAKKEQITICPQAHKGRMENFTNAALKYGLHESFFYDEETNPNVVYWRMWWPGKSELAYAVITNAKELKAQAPDLFDQMVRNGIYAYLRQVQPLVCKAIYGGDGE